jgi:MFS family permease
MFATAVPVAGDDHETWGHSSFAATHDFAGIGAVRFLLGFTEGAVAPSFMIITSNWVSKNIKYERE